MGRYRFLPLKCFVDVVNFIKEEESGKVEGKRKIEERGKKKPFERTKVQ